MKMVNTTSNMIVCHNKPEVPKGLIILFCFIQCCIHTRGYKSIGKTLNLVTFILSSTLKGRILHDRRVLFVQTACRKNGGFDHIYIFFDIERDDS